jgi:diguanylate cyclase (GGDEF)-like protein
MPRPFNIIRSWLKQEGQLMPRERRSLAVAAVAMLLLLPLGALEIQRRSAEIGSSQSTARLQKLETVIAALSGTERIANDWGRWDNSYGYVAGRNPGFISKDVANSALFESGAVIVLFDGQGRTLLSFSKSSQRQPIVRAHEALVACAHDNLPGLKSLDDTIWLGCRDEAGMHHLGVMTQVSNNDSTAPANGALVIFEPLLRSEYGPHLTSGLAALAADLRLQPGPSGGAAPGTAASPGAEANQTLPAPNPIHGPGRRILALKPESSLPKVGRSLLEDLILLVALLFPILVARAAVMLERRRQTLQRLRAERRSIRRVRLVCQQLDQLLDRVGFSESTVKPEDRVLARLLDEREHLESGAADPEAMESRLEELARRFQRFLDGAKSLALMDGITQLPNRRYFSEQLELEASRHRLAGTSLAILFVDIDKFKDINDTYGHNIGDASLAIVARRLRQSIGDQDFLARYGGDEFAILIDLNAWHGHDPISANNHLWQLAHEIGQQFEQPTLVDGSLIEISLSIGISILDPNSLDKASALRNCDLAMAEAKRNKHSRISIFTLSETAAESADYELYTDLLQAIRDRQLTVVFQPIVDVHRQLHAVEALARWHHPQQGWINPELFVGLAERYRKINLLGEELLRLALDGYARIVSSTSPDILLSVNISPSQLQDPSLAERIEEQLRRAGVPATSLTLELTEQGVIEASTVVTRNIRTLRQQGIRLSLDDFGTGYSSLNLLNSLQPDEVKIDRSFVEAMSRDNYARQIVMLVSQMAPSMGLELVAEGVSNSQSFALLQRHGIRHFQGFLFSPGVPAGEIRASYLPIESGEQPVATGSTP